MADQDRRLARIGRLRSQIEETRELIARQMASIESGESDDSDGWVRLVNLEEALETDERLLAQLMTGEDENP
jgi:hypothetical protein